VTWRGAGRLRLAGCRRIATATNFDLRREEAERGPSGRVEERGNHCGFPVHQAQAELTMAKALVEVQQRRQGGNSSANG
jgi:hypothetical protein